MFCNFSINIGIYSKKRGYVLMLKLVKEFGIKKSIIAGIFFITGLISLGYLMDNNEHIQYYHHQEGMSQGVGNLNHSGAIGNYFETEIFIDEKDTGKKAIIYSLAYGSGSAEEMIFLNDILKNGDDKQYIIIKISPEEMRQIADDMFGHKKVASAYKYNLDKYNEVQNI